MKHPNHTQTKFGRDGFSPRHIAVDQLIRAEKRIVPANSLEAALENARREAAALAWSTGFPFLLEPCLTEELEKNARDYWNRQTHIQQQSSKILQQTFPVVSRLLAA